MSGNGPQRRNWTKSLTIAGVAAVAALLAGSFMDKPTPDTDRLFFASSAGAVLFDHGKHSEDAQSCAQCHHDLYSAAPAAVCQDCHDDMAADAVSHTELIENHSRDCSTCHEETVDSAEAMSCRECHPAAQASQTLTNSCMECHEDEYTPEMMSHDEYQEIEDHSCVGCHTPRSVSEAYHTNCSACHLETASERFTTADGELQCGACHLR